MSASGHKAKLLTYAPMFPLVGKAGLYGCAFMSARPSLGRGLEHAQKRALDHAATVRAAERQLE
jgi:hypothetical protein